MAKFMEYYKEYIKEDQDEVKTICESASKVIYDRFRCKFNDPELLASVFSSIYYSIINKISSYESKFSEFEVNICDRLLIGYSTTENDDDEKQGNFQIYVRHLNSSRKNDDIAEADANTEERAVIWNATNIKNQPELLREISIQAKDDLKNNIDVVISSSEIVIPIFVTVYEMVIIFLTTKRRELDEFQYDINFCSCFTIGSRETEDDLDEIYIVPNIASKLTLKDDGKATAKYE